VNGSVISFESRAADDQVAQRPRSTFAAIDMARDSMPVERAAVVLGDDDVLRDVDQPVA